MKLLANFRAWKGERFFVGRFDTQVGPRRKIVSPSNFVIALCRRMAGILLFAKASGDRPLLSGVETDDSTW